MTLGFTPGVIDAGAESQAANSGIFEPDDFRRIAHGGLKTLRPALRDSVFRVEPAGIQRRREIAAIAESTAKITRHSKAELSPGCRNDRGFHERPFHAIERWRFMAFVQDSHGTQHHAGPQVEVGLDEEVEVGLLQSDLATRTFGGLDKRMFEFQFAPEFDAIRKAVAEEEDEAVEVWPEGIAAIPVDVKVHVARHGQTGFAIGCGLVVAGNRNGNQRRPMRCGRRSRRGPGSHLSRLRSLSCRQNRVELLFELCQSVEEVPRRVLRSEGGIDEAHLPFNFGDTPLKLRRGLPEDGWAQSLDYSKRESKAFHSEGTKQKSFLNNYL